MQRAGVLFQSPAARIPSEKSRAGIALGSEAEMQDVAVGDHIVLAFQPKFAGLARARFAAVGDVIVVGDGLGRG